MATETLENLKVLQEIMTALNKLGQPDRQRVIRTLMAYYDVHADN